MWYNSRIRVILSRLFPDETSFFSLPVEHLQRLEVYAIQTGESLLIVYIILSILKRQRGPPILPYTIDEIKNCVLPVAQKYRACRRLPFWLL